MTPIFSRVVRVCGYDDEAHTREEIHAPGQDEEKTNVPTATTVRQQNKTAR